jgi:hypothetical protein
LADGSAVVLAEGEGEDAERGRQVHVLAEVLLQTKAEIALTRLDQVRTWNVPHPTTSWPTQTTAIRSKVAQAILHAGAELIPLSRPPPRARQVSHVAAMLRMPMRPVCHLGVCTPFADHIPEIKNPFWEFGAILAYGGDHATAISCLSSNFIIYHQYTLIQRVSGMQLALSRSRRDTAPP